jgi:hypothetical protein
MDGLGAPPHCGALRARAEQQTKRRPHDELRTNRGDSNFHRTTAGNRPVGLSVDVALSFRSTKADCSAEVAASIIAAWQAAVR